MSAKRTEPTLQNLLDAGAASPRFWCECWKPHVRHPDPLKGEMVFQPYPYQVRLMSAFAKKHPVRVNKARQIGISTSAMVEAVRECIEHGPMTFVAGSRKEEVAKELLSIAALVAITHQRPNAPELTRQATQELRWSNGSRIVAETASPEMARSYAASVFILDEAAYLPDQEAIWSSMRPTVSRTSRVWIVSTPAGEGDAFHRMWEDEAFGGPRFQFPWQECPEYDEAWYARERPQYTAEAWAREFCCDFRGSGNVPFRPEVIDNCIALGAEAMTFYGPDLGRERGRHIITGVDPAGEGEDESVIVSLDTFDTPYILTDADYLQSVPAPILQAAIEGHQARHDSRLLIENNGLGWAVAQNLRCPYFTTTTTGGRDARRDGGNWTVPKTVLLNGLILAMESGNLAIPLGLTNADGTPKFGELVKQVRSYRWDDKGLRTDWVMALAHAVWPKACEQEGRGVFTAENLSPRLVVPETVMQQVDRLTAGATEGPATVLDGVIPDGGSEVLPIPEAEPKRTRRRVIPGPDAFVRQEVPV